MKQVVIFGAGGHAHVIADIVRSCGDCVVAFLDDDINAHDCSGAIEDYVNYESCEFVVGIGNAKVRERLSKLPVNWYTAIHSSAIISPTASVGEGTVVMPNAVINAEAEVGRHCIVNTSAVIEHNDIIEDYVHISVGAKLGGKVHIGKYSWIGIGATVINNIKICSECMLGGGTVAVDDITHPGTYVGVPAKRRVL